MTTIQAIEAIGIDPTICSGRPYLVGTTGTVADVAMVQLYHSLGADGSTEWYGLSLPPVYAALAYSYAHKPEIDEQVRTQIRCAETLKEQRIGSANPLLSR